MTTPAARAGENFIAGWEHARTGKFHRSRECLSVRYARGDDLIPVLLRVDDPLVVSLDFSCAWCFPKENVR